MMICSAAVRLSDSESKRHAARAVACVSVDGMSLCVCDNAQHSGRPLTFLMFNTAADR
jgi:hypothetical protein